MLGNHDPSRFLNPVLQRFIENKSKLNQPPKMRRTEFGKLLKTPVSGYKLYEGVGHCTEWTGDATQKIRQIQTQRKLFKLTFEQDGFALIWEACPEGKFANITACYMETPNYAKLKKHLKACATVIFEKQNHLFATARAALPREDGKTWAKDRRKEEVEYRRRFDNNEPIMVTRLFKFWCQFPRVVPRGLIHKDANKDELLWMSKRSVEMLTPEERKAIDGALQDRKRWSLSRTG